MSRTKPVVVVGGGILGLATARALTLRGEDVVVLEKEDAIATHQTGRNSGVVHAGLYYAPGSLKARTAVAGGRSMLAFAGERGIATDRCGKLVVAVTADERPRLHALAQRAAANGVDAHVIGPTAAREIEPHVSCVEALRVSSTAVIDFRAVAVALAEEAGDVRVNTRFLSARPSDGGLIVETNRGAIAASALVNCAGLYADRVAESCGVDPRAQIVPFRGDFYDLVPERTPWVRGLIYPVPDPRFPFLGVHLTRTVHGGVHAGPNAVLALKREGYRWRDVDARELRESLAWPGLRRLARSNLGPGAREIGRSLSKRAFARSVARLVPGLTAADLEPAPSGVRAQAVRADGTLVEDFLVTSSRRQVHVINAPSPAATASLEIASHLVAQLDRVRG